MQYLRSHVVHLVVFSCVVAALGAFTVFGENGVARLTELHAFRRALTDQAFRLCQENERLREQITRLHQDDHYLEAIARSHLDLVRDREIVYRFSNLDGTDNR